MPKKMIAALALSAGLLVASAGGAEAQTTYAISPAAPITAIGMDQSSPCEFTPCPTVTRSDEFTGSFTTAAPLGRNRPFSALTPVSYSFTVGGVVYSSANPLSRTITFAVSTDGAGVINNFYIDIHQWLYASHSITTEPASRYNRIYLTPDYDYIEFNLKCGSSPTVADTCGLPLSSTDYVYGQSTDVTRFAVVAVPSITSVSPGTGSSGGGTVVVITGANFTGTTSVTFGGVAATSVNVDSATQITATAPPGSGAVNVVVSGPGGASANTAADDFTYSVTSVPTLSEWAMILFGTLLAGGAALVAQRRRLTA